MKGIENSRAQLVASLKERLDGWNARVAQWARTATAAQSEPLAEYRSRRDAALYNLALLEAAADSAWEDTALAADDAWQRLEKAFNAAREHFEKPARK